MKNGSSDMYLAGPRVLDLSNTSITSLPSYISSLNNLRWLYLNNFRKLAVLHSEVGSLVKFPVGVITDLITLEQLVMEVNLEKKWWVLYWMGWLV
jgi:hypothetical protein